MGYECEVIVLDEKNEIVEKHLHTLYRTWELGEIFLIVENNKTHSYKVVKKVNMSVKQVRTVNKCSNEI